MPENFLRHIVLFKFTDGASATDIQMIENAFRLLPSKISLIRDFEWGTNISPENINQGFTHCFLVSFLSGEDRDGYLIHTDHKAFGSLLRPFLDKVLVIDYLGNK